MHDYKCPRAGAYLDSDNKWPANKSQISGRYAQHETKYVHNLFEKNLHFLIDSEQFSRDMKSQSCLGWPGRD